MKTRRERIQEARALRQQQKHEQNIKKCKTAVSLLGVGSSLGVSALSYASHSDFAQADQTTQNQVNNTSQEPTQQTPVTLAHTGDEDSQKALVATTGYGDEDFLGTVGDQARQLAADNDLYASVMIAQALLESNWGASDLGGAPNYNLFGIKGSYQGSSVNYSTLEDDGSGRLYTVNANFKKYPSYKASLEDYVQLLKHGTDADPTIYAGAFKSNTKSYMDATKWLTGRYATDTDYANKLNQLIEAYHLTQYDGPELVNYTVQSGDTLWNIAQKTHTDYYQLLAVNDLTADSQLLPGKVLKVSSLPQTTQPKTVTNTAKVVVTANDSLAKIAKINHTTVAELKTLNHLKSDLILVGQKLVIR